MKKVSMILLAFVISSPLIPSRLWASPCDADVEQYCGGEQPGSGTVADCIGRNLDKFTYQCREHLKKIDHYARKIGSACSFDARNYCRDVKPGYGRLKNCLFSNLDKLSNECRNAIQEPQ